MDPDTEELVLDYERQIAEEMAQEKVAFGPHVEELEAMLALLLKEEILQPLRAIETEEQARNSEERERAKEALVPIFAMLKFLERRTDITGEEYERVEAKCKTVSRAVGMINGGVVDHDR